jgi:hypothetical protein
MTIKLYIPAKERGVVFVAPSGTNQPKSFSVPIQGQWIHGWKCTLTNKGLVHPAYKHPVPPPKADAKFNRRTFSQGFSQERLFPRSGTPHDRGLREISIQDLQSMLPSKPN